MRSPLIALLFSLATCAAFAADPAGAVSARLHFIPDKGPWRGESAFDGAAWTKLGPGFEAGMLVMHARAGIGDKFPVRETEKVKLFDVVLVEGDDDHLTLEVRSKSGAKKIDVTRAKAVELEVEGVKYEFAFPTLEVAAAPNEIPSTNKATIIVARKKAKGA